MRSYRSMRKRQTTSRKPTVRTTLPLTESSPRRAQHPTPERWTARKTKIASAATLRPRPQARLTARHKGTARPRLQRPRFPALRRKKPRPPILFVDSLRPQEVAFIKRDAKVLKHQRAPDHRVLIRRPDG